MALPLLSPAERSYIQTGLADPKTPTRLDNRRLDDFRSLQISQGDAPQANGSARVVLGGKGGTEVMVGIKLEVIDAAEIGEEADEERKGKESWRASVEVDVTPQAFPYLQSQGLNSLSSYYANLISDHFVPYLPPLAILPPHKYFQPQIHVSLLSSTNASVPFVLFVALRAAFTNLHVPLTKYVGYEGAANGDIIPDTSAGTGTADDVGAGFVGGDAGLTGAVRAPRARNQAKNKRRAVKGKERQMVVTGKGRAEYVAGPGDDWDLEDLGGGDEGEGELMDEDIRLGLPVCVTLNLIPHTDKYFLDASRQEEIACPSRMHLFFSSRTEGNAQKSSSELKICGMRIEGGAPIELSKLPGLLMEGKRIATEMMLDLNKAMT